MTTFLDLRAIPTGGFVAHEVRIVDEHNKTIALAEFLKRVAGKNIVLVTHGFNVDMVDGEKSIAKWDALAGLTGANVFIGVLWPGDSRFIPVIDYPMEGSVANHSGQLLARFLARNATGAATLSFVSHSLGARTVLETIKRLDRHVSVLVLMAGAIENDCLTHEYASVPPKVDRIRVIASERDFVLEFAFPIGNPVGEIIMRGHPYFKAALGRDGPYPMDALENKCQVWQAPAGWDYGHGDYMPGRDVDLPFAPALSPPGSTMSPPRTTAGWKSSWSAGIIATQFFEPGLSSPPHSPSTTARP